jgi:hypothetical protein
MAIDANYTVDMEDEQFKQVDKDMAKTEGDVMNAYGGMIDSANKYYDDLAQNAQDWADKQTQLQQERTDFAIEQIEQQKDKAHKDYLKEQSGAYVDWQKQSNQYGVNAEKMAAAGLDKTGYSESSQVSMYNTYQNRVATARESYNNAVLNYNNAIKDAQLQNNATLAEIAYNALQQQLELSLEGFQYKNQLILEQANKKIELDNIKWTRYQDMLQQINTENTLKAEIDKHIDNQAWQTAENEKSRTHDEKMLKLQQDFGAAQAEIERKYKSAEAELERKHDFALLNAQTEAERKLAEEQHKRDMAKLEQQKKNEIAILNQKLANEKSLISYQNSVSGTKITGGSGGSGSSGLSNKQLAQIIRAIPNNFTGTTSSQAIAYAVKNGVPKSQASGILSMSEWSRRKNANSSSAIIKNSKTYQEYLQLQTEYLVDVYGK